MMDYFVDKPNTEEVLAMHGGGVMAGHTAECSEDVRKTMVLETVNTTVLWSILNASQAIHHLDAVSVGQIHLIVCLSV